MQKTFHRMLEDYADLAIRLGVGLRKGQRLIVRAPIESAPLARLMVEKAYQAGARLVEVIWTDDQTGLARFRFADRETFTEIPTAAADALLKGTERGDAVLSVYGTDPTLLKDQDPALVAKVQKETQTYLLPFSNRISAREVNWCLVAAPVEAWAMQVFPGELGSDATARLWDAIFRICRVDRPDPIAEWERHLSFLVARRAHLNAKQYAAFRFSGPGTDLTVGMPERHLWLGGVSKTARTGIPFVANLPTEEVFTMPHKDRVDGVVRSTCPLSHAGRLIEDFELTFAAGRVVNMRAREGEDVLRRLIETDEGASRLGEIALVPSDSPIAKSGLLFYNTLFDENAASHLAFGRAYRTCVEGGGEMSDLAFTEAGGNLSLVHTDFMVGSDQIDVEGILHDGKTEPVMRKGEWVEEPTGVSSESD